jgi:ferredoxin
MRIIVDETVCTGCGSCILSCPVDAVDNRPGFIARIDEDVCTQCEVCLDYCPTTAIFEQ